MGIARGRLAAALLLGVAVVAAQADARPGVKTARIGCAWLGPAGSDPPPLHGPRVKRIAYLWDPGSASSVEELASLKRLAPRLRVEIEAFGVREAGELGAALEAIRASRAGALLVDDDPLLLAARGRIVAFAARHRLLTVYEIREFVDSGGLISYGPSIADIHRRPPGPADR